MIIASLMGPAVEVGLVRRLEESTRGATGVIRAKLETKKVLVVDDDPVMGLRMQTMPQLSRKARAMQGPQKEVESAS